MQKFSIVVIGVLLFWDCQSSGINQTKDILVYGSDNCDHCVDFKAELDSVGFTYGFKDVEFSEALTNEMIHKVRAAGIMGQINYPVIDVEGKILVAPELIKVIELM